MRALRAFLAAGAGVGLTIGLARPLPPPIQPVPAPAAVPDGAADAVTRPVPARVWVRAAAGDVVHLVLGEGRLQPATVEVAEGGQVRLLVANRSRRPRNLVIPDFHLTGMALPPGEENYIEFTADRKGDFPMYSDASQPGRPEPGMLAMLRVR